MKGACSHPGDGPDDCDQSTQTQFPWPQLNHGDKLIAAVYDASTLQACYQTKRSSHTVLLLESSQLNSAVLWHLVAYAVGGGVVAVQYAGR